MKEYISIPHERTSRKEGVLLPVEVLKNVFDQGTVPTICANSLYPVADQPTQSAGLLVLSNSAGADELIGLLKELGTARSLEIAALLVEARDKNRRNRQ